MLRIGGVNGKIQGERSSGTLPHIEDIVARSRNDPAKTLVMTYFSQFVSDGYAEWYMRDTGDVELHFVTGEIFLLADSSITRLA